MLTGCGWIEILDPPLQVNSNHAAVHEVQNISIDNIIFVHKS